MRTVLLPEIAKINPKLPSALRETPDLPVSFVPMASVSETGLIVSEETRRLGDVAKGYTYFQRGDVLVAKITPCFENGKAALADNITCDVGFGTTEFHVIRPESAIDARYLFYMLWNPSFRAYATSRMTGSAGQKRVPRAALDELNVPIPDGTKRESLAEQRRIAAILDKADAIRRKREQSIKLADDFLRATFLDMFGDPVTNPKGWPVKPLGELIIGKANNGIFKKKGEYEESRRSGVPVVWVRELFGDWAIDIENSKTLSPSAEELQKFGLEHGDVLFCRSSLKREGIAQPNIYLGNSKAALFECHLIRVSPNSDLLESVYLVELLRSPSMRSLTVAKSKTATMTTIDQGAILELPIACPPKALQVEFTEVFQRSRGLRAVIATNKSEYATLFNSLLQRAFRGEL